ncbi:hypothetical protein ENBRE01_2809 [Enteropsectra breve]|nr:hypothetical protein ENBRE01_2809 [Enteropsectra breve]
MEGNPIIYRSKKPKTSEWDRIMIKKITVEVIKYIDNWKAPGRDHLYNFFVKKFTSMHEKLGELIQAAIENPNLIPEKMYFGITYLIPQIPEVTSPEKTKTDHLLIKYL